MPESNETLAELTCRVMAEFENQFGRRASFVAAAPGRVNLIGEHVDYNDGYVLPLALERYVVWAGEVRPQAVDNDSIRIHSTSLNQSTTIPLDQPIVPGGAGWSIYVEGVIAGFQRHHPELPAFDAVCGSNLPIGGGLSSSAALEVSTATLLEGLTGRRLDPQTKALLCQAAEHEFAGVPCGIMDQFSSVFGQRDHVLLIDCQSQTILPIPFDHTEVGIVITNSNVQHQLAAGEYAERRTQCDEALIKLNATSWRDVTLSQLDQRRTALTETERRRAKHVITEIQRTQEAAVAIRNSQWDLVGRLMYESHESLRDDFEVSCDELDCLVEIMQQLGTSHGIVGSRMTGGGFGGSTVSLIKKVHLDQVVQAVTSRYSSKTGIVPTCFSTRPGQGAHLIH